MMNDEEMQEMWDLHEQTRQGKNPCPKCGKPKQMYYQPWCPRCEKPEGENVLVFNFIQCLDHLEAIGYEGVKETLWKFVNQGGSMKGNDSCFYLYIPSADEAKDYNEKDIKALNILAENFGLKKGEQTLFWVSW